MIRDEFARLFVTAAGDPRFTKALDGPWSAAESSLHDTIAVRTKFFDEFFLAAAGAGVRQAIILASGLDSRAYRLDWPSGTTVFEIDQPKVSAFKADVLGVHGIVAKAELRAVAVDLRDDWVAELVSSGFDRDQPTAWSMEGLLPYLPSDAQDKLFAHVDSLSAPGSRIAVEAVGPTSDWQESVATFNERSGDTGALDAREVSTLFYSDDRAYPPVRLAESGWNVLVRDLPGLNTEYGLPASEFVDPMVAKSGVCYVTAER